MTGWIIGTSTYISPDKYLPSAPYHAFEQPSKDAKEEKTFESSR